MSARTTPKIGVLALQGAFELHRAHLESLGAQYVEVTKRCDFQKIDALILPGGESGVMLKLIDLMGIKDALSDFMRTKPAWGICAGAILMAKSVRGPEQWSFGALDIEVERNAYGRQLESSIELVRYELGAYAVSYIRAPKISATGPGVKILSHREGRPTWVEKGNLMATTFHPETNSAVPSPWHRMLYFKGLG